MSVIPEYTRAVLARDVPEARLVAGDMGVVVDITPDKTDPARALWYMLELFAADGSTIGVVTVPADAVRAPSEDDMLHVRRVAAE
jgi:hypothetical protein